MGTAWDKRIETCSEALSTTGRCSSGQRADGNCQRQVGRRPPTQAGVVVYCSKQRRAQGRHAQAAHCGRQLGEHHGPIAAAPLHRGADCRLHLPVRLRHRPAPTSFDARRLQAGRDERDDAQVLGVGPLALGLLLQRRHRRWWRRTGRRSSAGHRDQARPAATASAAPGPRREPCQVVQYSIMRSSLSTQEASPLASLYCSCRVRPVGLAGSPSLPYSGKRRTKRPSTTAMSSWPW